MTDRTDTRITPDEWQRHVFTLVGHAALLAERDDRIARLEATLRDLLDEADEGIATSPITRADAAREAE